MFVLLFLISVSLFRVYFILASATCAV